MDSKHGEWKLRPMYTRTKPKKKKFQWKLFFFVDCQLQFFEDVPFMELMYLACQVRVTVGVSGLCCCVHVMSFKH